MAGKSAKRAAAKYFDAFSFQPLEGAPAEAIAADGGGAPCYLVGPALFDPQVNGFGGVDFQNPDITLEALEHAANELRRAGCPQMLATLVTAAPDALTEQFRRIADCIERSERLREAILGFHLEGPFISPDPPYAGAHPAALTRDPDWKLFTRWQKASGGRIRLVTLAPERAGAAEFTRQAARSGVTVSLGHTNASAAQLWAAVEAGARLFTHLGNGCPGELPRHDNIIQRALAIPDLLASVIPDGIHVPPPSLANLLRALGPGRFVFTTDAMSAAGAPPGRYNFGPLETVVGADRIVRNPGANSLAGSALRPIDGLYNAIRFGGLGADAAWRGWTRLRAQLCPGVAAPQLMIPFGMGE